MKDQYKYFRIEARELLEGLNQAALELERSGNTKDLLGRLLRLAHTLKGASRVVKQPGIADLAHAVEDAYSPHRDGAAIPQEITNRVLGLLDAMSQKVASLASIEGDSPKANPKPPTEESVESVRIDLEEMDRLLEGVSETSIQVTTLRNELLKIDRARRSAGILLDQTRLFPRTRNNDGGFIGRSKVLTAAEELHDQLERLGRTFATSLEQVEVEVGQVREASHRLRLLPASSVFPPLQRAIRDAATTLNKQVVFSPSGGANRLDAHVLLAIRDALLHVVRNAVAHGIEHREERVSGGKPAQGCVELRVEQRGTRVTFVCRDDGRGIDAEAVRQAATRRGIVVSSQPEFGLDEAITTLLAGGVTTSARADEVSGRGVGLDVVRETVARLKGEVKIRSEAGKGTAIEICVPVSLSSLTALEVDIGGTVAAVPLASVCQTMRIADRDIAHSADRDSLVHEGMVLPFLSLPRAFGKTTQEGKRRFWSVIVLKGSSGTAAVGVDRLLGTENVVVRPLPRCAASEAIVAGACLNSEGDPELVLDADGLVAAARLGQAPLVSPVAAKRPCVLIVDDSLTTRMLEQSILESAGYEVEVATSGEEALAKARGRQYGLFLVDVEMPGMDGFEFVARTRADARLGNVPAILVTSRNAPEDRRRGEEAGARAYIVKGEFDQGYLLRMTRELLG
jgi:two-component system, chemotaxis family, sensor kinase CheA